MEKCNTGKELQIEKQDSKMKLMVDKVKEVVFVFEHNVLHDSTLFLGYSIITPASLMKFIKKVILKCNKLTPGC